MINSFSRLIAGMACLFAVIGGVQESSAASVSTGTPNSTIVSFGSPDTTSYGQTFKALDSVLTDWSFYLVNPTANFDLRVANWDGTKAVGPQLFSVSSTAAATSASTQSTTKYSWSGINLGLTTGTTYIAYITVAGVANPTSPIAVGSVTPSAYADGQFYFLNSNGVDPLLLNGNWNTFGSSNDLAFDATFTSAAVPEPASVFAWSMGIAAVVLARRRRMNA